METESFLTAAQIIRKRKIKMETESLLTVAHNDLIWTNYNQAKIYCTLQNSKCRSCDDRDETVNNIIECNKLAQMKYKIRHDWIGKVIYWELCKRLEFDHTSKWYMHKPKPIQENKTHKILWYFEIQTNHLIQTIRLDL